MDERTGTGARMTSEHRGGYPRPVIATATVYLSKTTTAAAAAAAAIADVVVVRDVVSQRHGGAWNSVPSISACFARRS